MNNKITLYDLLGLVKDGQAPKKFKYSSHEWTYNNESFVYWNEKSMEFEDYMENALIDSLNDELEILDNEDEDIEEIKNNFHYTGAEEELAKKINELVREVNKLKKTDYFKNKGE